MTANSLYPAYTLIEYHSAYAPHTMTIPNNTPDDVTGTPTELTLTAWDLSSRQWSDMVNDLVAELVPRFPDTVTFDRATLFTLATPTSDPFPRGSITVAADGTAGTPGWSKATQETIILRDVEAALMKLVLMDFASGNDFDKYFNAATIGVNLIVGQLSSSSNAWASRNGAQPSVFVARTATLNEKLRRDYHMA